MGSTPITRRFIYERKMRFLIPLEKSGQKEKIWKRKKGEKQKEGRRKKGRDLWINGLIRNQTELKGAKKKEYPVLADVWRGGCEPSLEMEQCKVPSVEAKGYFLDKSFFYLQSNLKRDIWLPLKKYYTNVEGLSSVWLDGLDIRVSCKKKVLGRFGYKRWVLNNRYYRRKLARLNRYYELVRSRMEVKEIEKNPRFLFPILEGGICVHWNQVEGRLVQPDWQVHYPTYLQRKRFLQSICHKRTDLLTPKLWRVKKKLETWVHKLYISRRPSFFFRREKRLWRRKVRWARRKNRGSFYWRPEATMLVFRKSGELVKREEYHLKDFLYDFPGVTVGGQCRN